MGFQLNLEFPDFETSIHLPISQRVGDQQFPDSKVLGANMGPTWDRQDPGGPLVGPMNLVIWVPNPLTRECGVIVAPVSCIQSGWNPLPFLLIRMILVEVTRGGTWLEVTHQRGIFCSQLSLLNFVV